jgi:hypothetical protein
MKSSAIALFIAGSLRVKRDGTRAETRFRLSPKRTSPFKSAGASVHSTAGSRCVRISVSNAGYTMFRGSVKSTGYPLHSPVSLHFPSRASPCAIRFQTHSNTKRQQVCSCLSPTKQTRKQPTSQHNSPIPNA